MKKIVIVLSLLIANNLAFSQVHKTYKTYKITESNVVNDSLMEISSTDDTTVTVTINDDRLSTNDDRNLTCKMVAAHTNVITPLGKLKTFDAQDGGKNRPLTIIKVSILFGQEKTKFTFIYPNDDNIYPNKAFTYFCINNNN